MKKKQKNWLPFWDDSADSSCRLLLSKRFAPTHEVGEFSAWTSAPGSEIALTTTAMSSSPARVPADTFVRGSAPLVSHPGLKPGHKIGCIHVKGKHKIYRHALYIQESSFPYKIVSFSSLFTFHPLRNIEFVMSLFVTGTGALQVRIMDPPPPHTHFYFLFLIADFATFMWIS